MLFSERLFKKRQAVLCISCSSATYSPSSCSARANEIEVGLYPDSACLETLRWHFFLRFLLDIFVLREFTVSLIDLLIQLRESKAVGDRETISFLRLRNDGAVFPPAVTCVHTDVTKVYVSHSHMPIATTYFDISVLLLSFCERL